MKSIQIGGAIASLGFVAAALAMPGHGGHRAGQAGEGCSMHMSAGAQHAGMPGMGGMHGMGGMKGMGMMHGRGMHAGHGAQNQADHRHGEGCPMHQGEAGARCAVPAAPAAAPASR